MQEYNGKTNIKQIHRFLMKLVGIATFPGVYIFDNLLIFFSTLSILQYQISLLPLLKWIEFLSYFKKMLKVFTKIPCIF